jgi:hypothetical protein
MPDRVAIAAVMIFSMLRQSKMPRIIDGGLRAVSIVRTLQPIVV